ncbi:regulatory LuxR family protein [Saccharothrix variisporea]|uniref:Regulatory LuxR family protein n=1 Tax=Saccharothrix variisporea TaxID=543527 RepID=A0A495XSA5_9PSEU|nr:regulatory LuxR family protein [Saccharothrix variisporea]
MADAVERAACGEGVGVLVVGGPGMGKTSLLREAVGCAGGRGFHVVRNLPDHSGLEVVGDLPVSFSVDGCRFPVARLAEWLQDLPATRSPVLVALDDVDRFPEPARRTVAELARTTRSVAWVATAGEAPPAEHPGATTVELSGWSTATVAEVVARRFDAVASVELEALLARAAGVPELVIGVVDGLVAEGRAQVVGGQVRVDSRHLPRRVHELVHRRLNSLSAKAWQVLRVASMLGPHFDLSDVSDLVGERTAMLLPELDEILAAGVLSAFGDHFAFRHDLVWDVVVDSIPEVLRTALRNDIDRVVGRRPVTRESRPDEAKRGSHAVLAVGGLAAAGRYAEAVRLARDTLEHPVHSASALELEGLLAHLLLWRGESEEAVTLAEKACARSASAPTVAAATAVRLVARSLTDPQLARHEAAQVSAAPTATDAVVATSVLARTSWAAGDLVDGLQLARHAVRDGGGHPWWGAWLSLELVDKLGQLGELAEAEVLLDSIGGHHDQWALASAPGRVAIERARLRARAGRWSDAVAQVRAGLGTAKESGCPIVVPAALAVLAKAALENGELPAAVQHVRHAAAVAAEAAVLPAISCDWVDLRITATTHGARAAVHALETRLTGLATSPVLYAEEPGAAAWLIDLARTVGSTELATTALDMIEHLAAANAGLPAVECAAAHARGLHDGDPALLDRAARQHVDAWAADHAREALATHAQAPAVEPGWDRLSDTQRTIARLAGAGLTNQQIAHRVLLSPHTVNYHLRGLYRKLGISSRVELARYV